jgi:hypothetical protein
MAMITKTSLLAAFLNAESGVIRDTVEFQCCMALVQAGKMDLCGMMPGDAGPVIIFRDIQTGRRFTVAVPLVK